MFIVGCDDLGAPFLTIVTCVTVGANIVRPRIRLTIMWEHDVLPYGVDGADEFTERRGEGTPPYGKGLIYVE